MSKKGLDILDVHPAFEQVAGKAVAAGMGRYPAGDAGFPGACLEELIDAGNIEIIPGP